MLRVYITINCYIYRNEYKQQLLGSILISSFVILTHILSLIHPLNWLDVLVKGHVQVLMNMIDHGMDPQQALDQPRLCIVPSEDNTGIVAVEPELGQDTIEALRAKGSS